MRKLFVLVLLVAILASSSVFGASGNTWKLIFPEVPQGTDTSLATLYADTTHSFDVYKWAPRAGALAINFGVSTVDADLDTMSVITEFAATPVGPWVIADSTEIVTTTTPNGHAETFAVVHADTVMQYMRIRARVAGDLAGTAYQTIILYAYVYIYDGQGNLIYIEGKRDIPFFFDEV